MNSINVNSQIIEYSRYQFLYGKNYLSTGETKLRIDDLDIPFLVDIMKKILKQNNSNDKI